jgi:ABC-2 type transport system ATP-binding protein
MKNVFSVDVNNNILTISYKKGNNNIGNLIDYLNSKKIKYNKIFSALPTLNDVFLELTGKELRD